MKQPRQSELRQYLKYLVLLWLFLLPCAASAGDISVSKAWLRVLPGDLPAGGYAVVANRSDRARVLVGASSPAFDRAMLHESVTRNGQDNRPVSRFALSRAAITSCSCRPTKRSSRGVTCR